METMFFQGSLQEGISAAVGQQKLVLCFVTDEKEESQKWEDEYLKDDTVLGLIQNQGVALRLKADSEEAGYLSQIFPLPHAPTIVMMKHGELKEYLTPGLSLEEFRHRVQGAFSNAPQSIPAPAPQPASALAAHAAPWTEDEPAPAAVPAPAPASAQAAAASASGAQQSENVRRILAERAAKLQEQKEAAERKAKEDRAKASQRAEADAKAGKDTDAARKHQQAEIVKKRKQQELDERRRILKRIEDDKEERRRAKASQDSRLTAADVSASLSKHAETKMPSTTKIGSMAAVQVRLFDGATLRSRFKTESPLTEVRKWVDESRTDGNLPYSFKQIISPQINKAVDVTEEGRSLGDLDLAPSATLVLIPVPKYAKAYGPGNGNLLSQLVAIFMMAVNWVWGLLPLSGSSGQAQDSTDSEHELEDRSQGASRVRGVQNPQDRRDQQLYNGNSLNFEPRPDDEDK